MAVRSLTLLFFLSAAFAFFGCEPSETLPAQPERGWSLSGKTYLAGSAAPLPGVTVRCAGFSSTSESDGTYEIRGVPGGTQVLSAEKAGCDPYSSSIEVNGDVTHFIYLGYQSTNLSGYVVNALDGPIEEARVMLGSLVHYTDISGRYEFTKAPRGKDSLYVFHSKYLGFKAGISLNTQDTTFDVSLKRDSVLQGSVRAFNYVDQSSPALYWPRFPNYQFLYLRANGYDSAGIYHNGIEQNILVNFDLPGFLADERASILEASFEMCLDGPYLPFEIKTYGITSIWNYVVTFNTQPPIGSLLFSGTIGDASPTKYWTVLGTDGLKTVIGEYRAKGETYGVLIKGGSTRSVGVYSSYGTINKPKITFKVRF